MRLSKAKRTFKRGYLPNCTEELFTMVRCIETNPPIYVVKDDHGEILEGTFYAEELQKFNEWHRPTQTVYRLGSLVEKRRLDRKSCSCVKSLSCTRLLW